MKPQDKLQVLNNVKLVCNNDVGLVWHKHIFIAIGD